MTEFITDLPITYTVIVFVAGYLCAAANNKKRARKDEARRRYLEILNR